MQKKWALRAATLTLGAGAALGLAVGTANAASLIQWGDSGSQVACLQQGLDYVNSAGLNVDSQFGQLTYTAVVNFQARHGLDKDGQVGPQTGGALKTDVRNSYYAFLHSGDNYDAGLMSKWMSNCNWQIPG
ncbi:peptidoglycan-binding domain-containing protein [Kitasatospora sp. NPDC097643]|uniref:peptidoglycan-binding domain-containing protein n=1 Tax=Kitasatospora sp. NPDC097643 TaxID=3157230 RepID=UPI0033306BF2